MNEDKTIILDELIWSAIHVIVVTVVGGNCNMDIAAMIESRMLSNNNCITRGCSCFLFLPKIISFSYFSISKTSLPENGRHTFSWETPTAQRRQTKSTRGRTGECKQKILLLLIYLFRHFWPWSWFGTPQSSFLEPTHFMHKDRVWCATLHKIE